MNKKIALILACCAATSFAACNETTEWNFTESCGTETKRCVESTIQVCKDGVWVPETTCEGNTPWCDVTTHTCIAKPAAKDCQDGAQKCDQDAVWTCKTGKWEKTTDCAADGKVCNSTTFVCDPKAQPEVTCDHNGIKLAVGATVCDGETTLKTCTANADGTTASLTSTDCSTDNKVCGNDADNKAACIDGQQPAPSVKCTKDGDETEYEVGAKYCGADNKLYTCTASADGTTATFESVQCQGDTPVCDNTANDCRAYNKCTLNSREVAHDALACDGNVSKKCNDGTLEIVKDCATDAQVCLADTGVCGAATPTACTDATVGAVENGKTVCKENNVWTCNNTQLSKTTDCTVTEAETAAHLVSVCTPGEQGANATCVKKCAEDYKFGEGDKANKCVAAHDQQCKINTVGDKQVAQYRTAESEGGYTAWNNCAKDDFSIYGCKENKECDLTGCVDTHEIATIDGKKVCVKKKVNNCGNDVDGKKAEMDTTYCTSETQYAMCANDGQNVYTSLLFTCPDTYQCVKTKVNDINGCACTEATAPTCKVKTSGAAYISACNLETGELVDEDCPMPAGAKSTSCDNNKCDFVCGVATPVKNQAGTACVKCTDPTATQCPVGKFCKASGLCSDAAAACTANYCKDGLINYCVDAEGAKKYSNAVSCIKNGVGKCKEGSSTECDTEAVSCNVDYMLVQGACEKYDTVECTTGVCTDSHYFGCPAAAAGEAKRYHSAPVAKPADDANGTWACDVAKGWDLTCTETELYEVKDGKCALKPGKCKTDTDCTDATKTKCNTTTKTCEASVTPAPECTDAAIQCVSDAKYKTCTGGTWDTTEKTVDAGLKCEANSLKCIADSGCVGNISYLCEEGVSAFENCEDESKVCVAGACVAGGGTTPAPTKSLIISELAGFDNGSTTKHQLKFIELFNPTDKTVDLNDCNIVVYKDNSSNTDYVIPLSGSIEKDHVFLICGSYVNDSDEISKFFKSKCNLTHTNGLDGFGARKITQLKCGDQTIDITGKIGSKNTIKVSGNNATNIIRQCGITVGIQNTTTELDLTKWIAKKTNVEELKSSLGTHKAVCDAAPAE